MALSQIQLEIDQPLGEDQKRGNQRDKGKKIIRATDKQKFLMLEEQTKMKPNPEASDPGNQPGCENEAHRACRE